MINRNAERQLDASWREAIRIVFQQRVLASASEFPESLSNKEKHIRDSAVDFITKQTGTAPGYVRNALTEAAHNYFNAKPSELILSGCNRPSGLASLRDGKCAVRS